MPNGIIPNNPNTGGALSAEHYQTFELAKEHDSVLGGTDIAQIRTYAAFARARAQAVHKSIATMNRLDDVTATKAEMTETAQTFAKVGIYADQRIGEILRELPTRQGKRTDTSSTAIEEVTKAQALKDSGISTPTAYQLEQLAANPDVVQAVLDKAEADGRIPSRKQVLDAIKERDDARETVSMVKKVSDTLKRQRDEAREDNEQYKQDVKDLQEEIRALEKQNDQLFEKANAAQEPRVITREVVPKQTQERLEWLEHLEQVHTADNQKLRKKNEELRRELDKAKDMLGMDKTLQDVRRDVQYLTTATNAYVRQYGGLTWTVQQLADVDAPTLEELRKAVANLATFSNALATSLEDFTNGR